MKKTIQRKGKEVKGDEVKEGTLEGKIEVNEIEQKSTRTAEDMRVAEGRL